MKGYESVNHRLLVYVHLSSSHANRTMPHATLTFRAMQAGAKHKAFDRTISMSLALAVPADAAPEDQQGVECTVTVTLV